MRLYATEYAANRYDNVIIDGTAVPGHDCKSLLMLKNTYIQI